MLFRALKPAEMIPNKAAQDSIIAAPILKEDIESPNVEKKDYVEHQVLAVTDSKREARKIASAIGGELISYDNNVAVFQIGMTVEELMKLLEEDSSLPRVYPNYQNYTSN